MKARHRVLITALTLSALACQTPNLAPTEVCAPLGYTHSELMDLRAGDFVLDNDKRERFALDLAACLGNPDAQIREQIAFEGYVALLRNKQLSQNTIRQLLTLLSAQISVPYPHGLRSSFTALALAEVARTDRIDPVFSADERIQLVNTATQFMQSIKDYRGFDAVVGWRHAVAHTADLLMQLSLNPEIKPAQLQQILDAVASQVAPAGEHFYIYGEGERLARPVLFTAQRQELAAHDWEKWFEAIASPAPMTSWNEAFKSQQGLAKLHNTKAFVQAIYINAAASSRDEFKPLAERALNTLRALP